MALYWTDKNGRKWPVCECLKEWLTAYQDEALRLGYIKHSLDLYQAIGNAKASAGYHSKGGCVDDAQDSVDMVRLGRNMGGAAFARDSRDGMSRHCHIGLKGCPHMVAAARSQIGSLEAGRNGLVNNAKDRGPRTGIKWPLRTWKEGIAWAKAQAKPAPTEPAKEPTPVTDATFNYLGMNIYASQYTGGKFSAGRKAALKATFAGPTGANASWNALSEVNSNLDHDTVVSLLGAQFNHSDTFTRAAGNNHHYPDANKWEKVRAVEIELLDPKLKDSQHRTLVLTLGRHKVSGLTNTFGATHLSSASAFRDRGESKANASKLAAAHQIAEAKAIAKILADLPNHLPGADLDRFICYFDTNREDGIAPYLDGQGTTDVYDLIKVGNREYGSLHTLGEAPAEDGKHIDRVRVGKKVKVLAARQIIDLYDATDHLGLACQFQVFA